jgi:hypothetical protein
MLETSPSFHCGGTFGHAGSMVKVGTPRVCAWAAVCAAAAVGISAAAPIPAAATNAITTALGFVCFICFLRILVLCRSDFDPRTGIAESRRLRGMVAAFGRGGKAQPR